MLNRKQAKSKKLLFGTADTNSFSDAQNAWFYCKFHRKKLLKSSVCGCFYCLKIFPPKEIVEWCDRSTTALCPYCGIDSVIGEDSGYPITVEFLQEMKRSWFK